MTKELGYVQEILTQAPETNPAALAGKLRWIIGNLKEYTTDFAMVRNKGRYYGRVLVDDYPGFIEPWLEHRKNGLVIMPSNEYNQEFSHPQVIRYDGRNKEEVRAGLVGALH
ncbi:hypothetical protein CMO92_00015 [Candidatus Woesearchaeota archaeon]|nr:hypothetical protein [Candidatus Woesearchaeota archaeon]|tara:strand:+ start:518 stop:853 length:336 start_codon:yes stop_codon:yes gene_type:complete